MATSRGIRIAFSCLAVAAGAAGLLMVAGGRDLPVIGGVIQLSSGADGDVWMIANHEVLRTDAVGTIRLRLSAPRLGLRAPLTALAAHPDGGAWVGQVGGPLVRIDTHGAVIDHLDPAATPAGPLQRTFKIAVDPQSHALLLADTGHHRMLSFDAQGTYLGQSATPWRFPNAIRWHPDGHFLVADTNGQRVAAVDVQLREVDWEAADTRALRSFEWPVHASAAPDGNAYFSWHDDQLRLGVVLAHDRRGRFRHSLDLPKGTQPQALLARAGDVLVAVQDGAFRVRRFSHSGAVLPDFGSAELHALLAQAWARHSRATLAQTLGQQGLLAAALGLLLTALIARRRQNTGAAADLGMREEASVSVLQQGRVGLNFAGLAFLMFVVAPVMGCLLIVTAPPGLRFAASLLAAVTFAAAFAAGLRSLQTSPAFADWRARQLDRVAHAWAPHLPALLRRGERLVGHAAAPGLFQGRILFATSHRLLLLPALAGPRRAPLWQVELAALAPFEVRAVSGWQKLVAPGSWWIDLDGPQSAARTSVCVTPGSLGEQLLAVIAQAQEMAQARTQEIASGDELAPPPAHPATLRVVLLSLLLPGAGHLHQRRTQLGLALVALALAVLLGGLPFWAVAFLNFADYPRLEPWRFGAMYAALVAFAALSAARYARADR